MEARIGRIVPAVILVLGLGSAADAQFSAAIRGVVHDSSGQPTPGAVVTISHPTTPTVRVAVTNLNGEYVVRGLETGVAYRVHVTHPNFKKQRLEARAFALEQDQTTVRLKPRRATAVARR
jgi:hypothetical protein